MALTWARQQRPDGFAVLPAALASAAAAPTTPGLRRERSGTVSHTLNHTDNRIVSAVLIHTEGKPLTDGRSLVGVVGAVLPTAGGVCCVGLSAGVATVGGVTGAALAWLTPLLLGIALILAGALLLRARSGRPWHRWHGLVAVASASYLVSALVVVPLLPALLGSAGTGGEVLS